VNVVALTSEAEIVLVREYRHGVEQVVTGLPSGWVEPTDESPEAAIRRELAEETGFVADDFCEIGCSYANPANQTNSVWSFLALGAGRVRVPAPDGAESLQVLQVPFASFLREVRHRRVQLQALHLAALHYASQFAFTSNDPRLRQLRRTFLTSSSDASDP
jgi:ADP-ribose pyrophosphatase